MQKPETTTTTAMSTPTSDPVARAEAQVPFFARKAGRPSLTVHSGLRAGARESDEKRG